MAFFNKFFGRTIGEAAAFALGMSTRNTIDPLVQDLANETWSLHPDLPLEANDLAAIVAERVDLQEWGRDEARLSGVNAERFDALAAAARNAPGVAELFDVWRRGLIDDFIFEYGLKKLRLEDQWIAPLKGLKQRLLGLAELANARQQGFVDADRQRSESALQGLDADRADILFEITGLPPGAETAQEALNRGLIDDATFAQMIREGHTKTKYTDLLRTMRQPVLSAAEYATLHLKAWITEDEMNAGGALSGYSAAQMHLMFLARGRPMAPTQMWTAWARDAPGPYGGTFAEDDFKRGIAQSDIRPEYGDTLWAIRYVYPSLFQMRMLVSSGTLDRPTALDILHKERYEPTLAAKMVDGWMRSGTGTTKGLTAAQLAGEFEGNYISRSVFVAGLENVGYSATEAAQYADYVDAKRVITARTAALSTIRSAYVGHRLHRDDALAALDREKVPQPAQGFVMVEWDNAREANTATLTAAQLRAAYQKDVIDRATAEARMADLGWYADDVRVYLDTPPGR